MCEGQEFKRFADVVDDDVDDDNDYDDDNFLDDYNACVRACLLSFY